MEKICLGKVVKLHGYLGEVKMIAQYDDDLDFKKIESMFDENDNEYKVKRIMKNTDGFYIGFEDVDLEKAKALINKQLFIDRNLVAGKILIEDLKGSTIYFEDDSVFGKIDDVQDFGAAEVFYVISTTGREYLFPNVKGVIVSFDYKQKKLVVNKDKLREVCDYENWYFNAISWNVHSAFFKHNGQGNKRQ